MKNTAIGLLTGSLCLLLGRASSAPAEPLHPRSIVNLSGFETMGPGENLVVYQVPNDAWLVVTDADRASEPVAVCGFGYIDAGGYHDLLNATDFHDGYHSSTGLACPPGSKVAIGNPSASAATPWWDLTGYLVE